MTTKSMKALCNQLGIVIPKSATVRKRAAAERCCFCGGEYANIGNNPAPVIDDEDARCCNFCNGNIVLRARLALMYAEMEGKAV